MYKGKKQPYYGGQFLNWKTDKRRLTTVFLSCSVGSADGGLSPESAELLRSAYDAMMSAVGDLGKAAAR